jgi:RNA polymerase sigma-70 factor (ECF subfamily)
MAEDVEDTGTESQTTGNELAARFRQGDERAFDEIVKSYQKRIFNLAYRMLNHYEEAADLTQEIFVKVYRSMSQFRGESAFTTWLYAIAINMCRTRLVNLRRRASREALTLDAPLETEDGTMTREFADPGQSLPEQLEKAEAGRELKKCLADLPPDFAAVLVMRDLQQMSYAEIARAAHASIGTVKSRIARGRLLLVQKMKRNYRA